MARNIYILPEGSTYDEPIDQTYTLLYVDNYGAHGNGVTNDSDHIQAAYNAARALTVAAGTKVKIIFTSGKTYFVDRGWAMGTIRTNDWYGQTSPTYQQRGIICFSGYGATIKYANNSTRYSWLQHNGSDNTTILYTTYGNLEIEGFTIDPNNRTPTSESPSIIYLSGEGNLTNITIKDITVLNNMNYRTAYNSQRTLVGVSLKGSQSSRAQLHYGYCTDITVEGCTINAQGKGIAIYAHDMGTETVYGESKYIYDNIVIDNCWINNNRSAGSNIHLGSYGAGNRCWVTNTHIEDSTDNGLEIDAFNYAYVDNITCDKLRAPIGITRFSWPYLSSTPDYIIKNVTWSGTCTTAYWPTDMVTEPAIASPELEVVELRSGLTARRFGNFTFENCNCEVKDEYTHDNHWIYAHAPMDSVTISDCEMTIAGSDSYDPVYVSQSSTAGISLPVSIHRMLWRNSPSNAYAALTASQVTLSGTHTIDSDIPGLV